MTAVSQGHSFNVYRPVGGPYACPCCGYLTLDERGGYEICSVCFWDRKTTGRTTTTPRRCAAARMAV